MEAGQLQASKPAGDCVHSRTDACTSRETEAQSYWDLFRRARVRQAIDELGYVGHAPAATTGWAFQTRSAALVFYGQVSKRPTSRPTASRRCGRHTSTPSDAVRSIERDVPPSRHPRRHPPDDRPAAVDCGRLRARQDFPLHGFEAGGDEGVGDWAGKITPADARIDEAQPLRMQHSMGCALPRPRWFH